MFQGGRRVTKTIPATAGNVAYNLSPGAGKRFILLRGRLGLVADVTVANRKFYLQLTDGTNITARFLNNTTAITASQSKGISLLEEVSHIGGEVGIGDLAAIGIGRQILEGADQLKIGVDGGVAGDSFSGYIVVLEIDL